ncbi:transcriptional coactivator YAP1-A [Daktulosphaira vitifoliae]|uniref:transcriptional coactivator YAP1-A n=1 Tax=Daktulosphaira vitifoliae TaxID=58002 RepID=UPI0021AA10AA|nr:transcriptional coactivator YAP1-A [Daktulosphaira vitifoliae]
MSSLQEQQQPIIKMEPGSPVASVAANNNNNLVVRVDQDSETDLQALFDTVLKPNGQKPLQLPLRMRQLPKSFFNPPSTGSKSPSISSISHSRENSGDSAFGTTAAGACITTTAPLHSRAHSSPASLQQTYAVGLQQKQQQHVKQHSYDVSSAIDELGPLPQGWEQARTPEGQIYFLNHLTRTTQWEDPRKSLAAQTANQHQRSAEQLLSPGNDSGSSTNTTSTPTNSPPHIHSTLQGANKNVTLGPLPEGWEQAITVDGETYFINHLARTTSWFDPRIPAHLQRAPTSGAVLPSGSASWLLNGNGASGLSQSLQVTQQKLRLHSLQLERERLKIRQQEIIRQQELMLRSGQTTNDLDPFLSCSSSNIDHSRQESADSGLGLGNNYSLPHTPEDFLSSNMDDNMDCTSESDNPGPSSNMSVVDSQEMASLDVTDDLVPSLQLGDEFSSDILDEVQSLIDPNNKPGSILTWL